MESILDRSEQEVILVVDDQPGILVATSELLRQRYRVETVGSGGEALLRAAMDPQPDLILLDILMPGMDGYEVCRQLKADPRTCDIPVIFLTGMASLEDEQKGLDLGAVDFLLKPVSPPVALARVRTHLALKANADFLRDKSEYLELEVRRRARELQAIQDAILEAMATLCDLRDRPHSRHLLRVEHYMRLLAGALARNEEYAGELSVENIELMARSAMLHDIGNAAVPDRILLNPGHLDEADWLIMRNHTRVGRDALEAAERKLGYPAEFLRYAKEIAYSHHERWDGAGFPEGLAGERIPLAARLLAVVDTYEDFTSRRVYHTPLPPAEAAQHILAGSGSHFDPQVVEAFAEVAAGFARIAERYADDDQVLELELQRLEEAVAENIELEPPQG
ncbi:response regulator [Pseudomonas jinjuensis]|uniref:Putative two-component system response regulator n=1 Tax=Pseudomonas jinjuensis TaxID=198616 RepID=A0A1H0MS03_9PSED|nr:two-component system response regulator [Pseudomonas jinjuensis]SDO83124.1 putative two-component system response regulator [Pseudomonas jinjuensis]